MTENTGNMMKGCMPMRMEYRSISSSLCRLLDSRDILGLAYPPHLRRQHNIWEGLRNYAALLAKKSHAAADVDLEGIAAIISQRLSSLSSAAEDLKDSFSKSDVKDAISLSLSDWASEGTMVMTDNCSKRVDQALQDYESQQQVLKLVEKKEELKKQKQSKELAEDGHGNKEHPPKMGDHTLKECQRKLKKAFYDVIRLIPNEDWLEFVRCSLDLEEDDFKDIVHDLYSKENKMKMLGIWRKKEKSKTGVGPTAEQFIDLVDEFLQDRPEVNLKPETPSKPGDLLTLFRETFVPSCNRTSFHPTFNKACYFVIRIMPDSTWMEFVYFGLELCDDDIGHVRCDLYDKEKKHQMLLIWKNIQPETPTASDLLKTVAEFLKTKPRDSASVKYNIGVVNAENFVGNIGTKIEVKSDEKAFNETLTSPGRKRSPTRHWSEVITATDAKIAKMVA